RAISKLKIQRVYVISPKCKQRNQHRKSLSITTVSFEPTLKDKRQLYEQIHDKWILKHDNARPHVANLVKTYLERFNVKSYPTPGMHQTLPLPIITCSDRWRTACLSSNSILMKMPKKNVDSWLASKDVSFFRCGIQMLSERWVKVVARDK
ncbi:hypothetical protein AVEN_118208-2-1, partial [Araneus ventricosus]